MRKIFFFLLYLNMLTASYHVYAQIDSDSTEQNERTVTTTLPKFNDSIFKFFTNKPSAKRAGLYSALVPGLGQLYNKQYWKLGLVYAGLGVISGFMISNVSNYRKYQRAYIYRIDNNPDTPVLFPEYTTDDLNALRKGFRQYTEYTVIAATVGYLLNILDAYISAHLRTFDMSKDISFRFNIKNQFLTQSSIGIGVRF